MVTHFDPKVMDRNLKICPGLVSDLEARGFVPRPGVGLLDLPDIGGEVTASHRVQESSHLVGVPGGDHLHPAIGQIADPTHHLEPGGDLLDGIAEPDTLHPSRIENPLVSEPGHR